MILAIIFEANKRNRVGGMIIIGKKEEKPIEKSIYKRLATKVITNPAIYKPFRWIFHLIQLSMRI